MKLLYIIDRLSQGGISTVLIHRLNFLASQTDFEIHILSEVPNDPIIQKQFSDVIHFHTLNYKVLSQQKRLPFFGFFGLQKDLKSDFKSIIKKIQPDIITTFNVDAMNNFIIPTIKTSAIKIIEFHGAYDTKTELIKRKLLPAEPIFNRLKLLFKHPVNIFVPASKKLQKNYDYGIVLTKEDLQNRKSYLNIPLKHIYNFMLFDNNIKTFDQRENIILGVGRMVPQKNLLHIVEAVNLIKDKLYNWQVHIYGDGEQRHLIEAKVLEYQLQKLIILKGFSYNMAEVYNNSKLLVTPALWEGQPMNILEAFSYKIPVISYDCKCGPKEIIRDGVNGYLVDFNISDLASRILQLISDEKLLESFSIKTTLDMHLFDFENLMNEWIDFYNSLELKN